MHVAEKLVFHSDRGPLRFEQSAAIVGPNDYGPVVMPSGFSLYTVTDGVIDAGTFVPLAMPGQQQPPLEVTQRASFQHGRLVVSSAPQGGHSGSDAVA